MKACAVLPLDQLMSLDPESERGVFTYHRGNLGDHIQTLALLQHVKVRSFVPRDDWQPDSGLTLVANGWLTTGPFPDPSHFRRVHFVGVHVVKQRRNEEAVEALRRGGVVGCRDEATRRFLRKRGVPAFRCGCATLTFPRFVGPRRGVVVCDVNEPVRSRILETFPDAELRTHKLPMHEFDSVKADTVREQYASAYEHLERYREAELVITSRVHVTLPCLAFGTPVIYAGIAKRMDDRVTILNGLHVRRLRGRLLRLWPRLALRTPPVRDVRANAERYIAFLRERLAGGSHS